MKVDLIAQIFVYSIYAAWVGAFLWIFWPRRGEKFWEDDKI